MSGAEAGLRRRKVIYLSGTRADFGLMKSALLHVARVADLSVAVTGMHLDAAFGHTVDEIRAAGLTVCGEIPVDVVTRTPRSMSAAIGDCLMGVTDLLQREQPDILLLLGDRGEMLAGAIAALHLGIVSVHVHGGERSGTVDEPVRHAISKLATYHFVATAESKDRLLRMGESESRIVVTGAPGLDGLHELVCGPRKTPDGLRATLGLPPQMPFVLALFHPVVQQACDAYAQTVEILVALQKAGLPVVWPEPNADAGSLDILRAMGDVPLPQGSVRARHLPRDVFCAAMKHCAVMVGNSSSGIIEAASFGTPVVNVGDRQRLRERNDNVEDTPADRELVHAAIAKALRHGKWPCDNRYGDGRAGERIAAQLASLLLDRSVLEKTNTY
ncbi:MAG: UDP-N-acetylglucosamine 2-epimerase (hydrolyzing) [Comamonadaceae bacterium]|nr:MAG: UDP-N-acetylglucosamine 2-epimerase (hydrolyzing) [Comamonadaceae bacterium]